MFYDLVIVVALWMLAAAIALPLGTAGLRAGRDPVYTFYLAAVWFSYLGWCWRRGGMTLGMRTWRVRIESIDGGPPSWRQCVVRFAASLLSAGAAGFGFVASLFDPQMRTWHDRLSRTRLVHFPGKTAVPVQTERRSA